MIVILDTDNGHINFSDTQRYMEYIEDKIGYTTLEKYFSRWDISFGGLERAEEFRQQFEKMRYLKWDILQELLKQVKLLEKDANPESIFIKLDLDEIINKFNKDE